MEAVYDVWPYVSVGGQLGAWWASLTPLAQLLFLPGQSEVLFGKTEFIAYFGAVNLSDRRCLHPWLCLY